MSITANALYRDTGNFIRHQFTTIALITLLTTLIVVVLNHALSPSDEQIAMLLITDGEKIPSLLNLIQNMTPEQQKIFSQLCIANAIPSLLGDTLLLGSILGLIPRVSAGTRLSALQAIGAATPLYPRMLLLTFLMTLIIQLGIILWVIPAIIACVLLSLAPIVLVTEKKGVLGSLKTSITMVWPRIKLVAPAMAIWILAQLVLLILVKFLTALSGLAVTFILSACGNFISVALLIYLYRLYMLTRTAE